MEYQVFTDCANSIIRTASHRESSAGDVGPGTGHTDTLCLSPQPTVRPGKVCTSPACVQGIQATFSFSLFLGPVCDTTLSIDHPMLPSYVTILCYQPVYYPLLPPYVTVLCYQPVYYPCYHPVYVTTLCYHPMLSAYVLPCVITMSMLPPCATTLCYQLMYQPMLSPCL